MPRRVVSPQEHRALRLALSLNPDTAPRLVQRLRELRTEHGLSLDQVATACGLSGRGATGAWESGISTPDPPTLMLLADLYGVTLDYLFGAPEAQRDSIMLQNAKAALTTRLQGVDWRSLTVPERLREAWLAVQEAGPHAFPPLRIGGLIGGLEPESFAALVSAQIQPSTVVIGRFAWALGISEQLLLTGKWS